MFDIINDLELFVTIFLLLFYVNILREIGALYYISNFINNKFKRSHIFIPMFIGLIPMPGGAYFSASILKSFSTKNVDLLNFINYWYRHVFVFSWPLYPSLIVAMKILDMSYPQILKSTIFLSILAIFVSIPFVFRFKAVEKDSEKNSDLKPFLPLLIFFVSSLFLKIYLSIAISFISIILLYKLKRKHIISSIKNINYKILLFIAILIMYEKIIYKLGINNMIYNIFKDYDVIVIILLTFLSGVITGIEFATIMVSFPLIKDLLNTYQNIFLAFSFSFVGVILSPMHLCLILSTKELGARLIKTYRYIIVSTISLTILVIIVYDSFNYFVQ